MKLIKKKPLSTLSTIKNLNEKSLKNNLIVKSKTKTEDSLLKEFDVFFNFAFDKGRLKSFVVWFLKTYGESKTIILLEKLKEIGFGYATKAGISLGIDDLRIPPEKTKLLQKADKKTNEGELRYIKGAITAVERLQNFINVWHETSENLKKEVVNHFEATDILNPVYMMAFSGARGNLSQVRQLVGMRGLMSDPQGQIIDFPIRSNFREGLTLTEYVISTYGARKGIVDTALRTANAGYLTRRLVDVAQHVIVSEFDCKTPRGIFIFDMKEGAKTIYPLQQRLIGRVLAEDVFSGDKQIASRNEEISKQSAEMFTKLYKKFLIRSPLTCATKTFVCQLCYGWSLATNRLVPIGEAVGVIAGQSIGEPGTQLTMRTFHTGGVFSGGISDQITAQYDCLVEYPTAMVGNCVRTPQGDIAFLTKTNGYMILKPVEKNKKQESSTFPLPNESNNLFNTVSKVLKVPPYSLLFARNGQRMVKEQLIGLFSSVGLQERQTMYSEQVLYSDREGEVYTANMKILELTVNQTIRMKTGSEDVPKQIQFVTKDWSELLILGGKNYQIPVDSTVFPHSGDFISSNSILNRISWITPENCNLKKEKQIGDGSFVSETKNIGFGVRAISNRESETILSLPTRLNSMSKQLDLFNKTQSRNEKQKVNQTNAEYKHPKEQLYVKNQNSRLKNKMQKRFYNFKYTNSIRFLLKTQTFSRQFQFPIFFTASPKFTKAILKETNFKTNKTCFTNQENNLLCGAIQSNTKSSNIVPKNKEIYSSIKQHYNVPSLLYTYKKTTALSSRMNLKLELSKIQFKQFFQNQKNLLKQDQTSKTEILPIKHSKNFIRQAFINLPTVSFSKVTKKNLPIFNFLNNRLKVPFKTRETQYPFQNFYYGTIPTYKNQTKRLKRVKVFKFKKSKFRKMHYSYNMHNLLFLKNQTGRVWWKKTIKVNLLKPFINNYSNSLQKKKLQNLLSAAPVTAPTPLPLPKALALALAKEQEKAKELEQEQQKKRINNYQKLFKNQKKVMNSFVFNNSEFSKYIENNRLLSDKTNVSTKEFFVKKSQSLSLMKKILSFSFTNLYFRKYGYNFSLNLKTYYSNKEHYTSKESIISFSGLNSNQLRVNENMQAFTNQKEEKRYAKNTYNWRPTTELFLEWIPNKSMSCNSGLFLTSSALINPYCFYFGEGEQFGEGTEAERAETAASLLTIDANSFFVKTGFFKIEQSGTVENQFKKALLLSNRNNLIHYYQVLENNKILKKHFSFLNLNCLDPMNKVFKELNSFSNLIFLFKKQVLIPSSCDTKRNSLVKNNEKNFNDFLKHFYVTSLAKKSLGNYTTQKNQFLNFYYLIDKFILMNKTNKKTLTFQKRVTKSFRHSFLFIRRSASSCSFAFAFAFAEGTGTGTGTGKSKGARAGESTGLVPKGKRRERADNQSYFSTPCSSQPKLYVCSACLNKSNTTLLQKNNLNNKRFDSFAWFYKAKKTPASAPLPVLSAKALEKAKTKAKEQKIPLQEKAQLLDLKVDKPKQQKISLEKLYQKETLNVKNILVLHQFLYTHEPYYFVNKSQKSFNEKFVFLHKPSYLATCLTSEFVKQIRRVNPTNKPDSLIFQKLNQKKNKKNFNVNSTKNCFNFEKHIVKKKENHLIFSKPLYTDQRKFSQLLLTTLQPAKFSSFPFGKQTKNKKNSFWKTQQFAFSTSQQKIVKGNELTLNSKLSVYHNEVLWMPQDKYKLFTFNQSVSNFIEQNKNKLNLRFNNKSSYFPITKGTSIFQLVNRQGKKQNYLSKSNGIMKIFMGSKIRSQTKNLSNRYIFKYPFGIPRLQSFAVKNTNLYSTNNLSTLFKKPILKHSSLSILSYYSFQHKLNSSLEKPKQGYIVKPNGEEMSFTLPILKTQELPTRTKKNSMTQKAKKLQRYVKSELNVSMFNAIISKFYNLTKCKCREKKGQNVNVYALQKTFVNQTKFLGHFLFRKKPSYNYFDLNLNRKKTSLIPHLVNFEHQNKLINVEMQQGWIYFSSSKGLTNRHESIFSPGKSMFDDVSFDRKYVYTKCISVNKENIQSINKEEFIQLQKNKNCPIPFIKIDKILKNKKCRFKPPIFAPLKVPYSDSEKGNENIKNNLTLQKGKRSTGDDGAEEGKKLFRNHIALFIVPLQHKILPNAYFYKRQLYRGQKTTNNVSSAFMNKSFYLTAFNKQKSDQKLVSCYPGIDTLLISNFKLTKLNRKNSHQILTSSFSKQAVKNSSSLLLASKENQVGLVSASAPVPGQTEVLNENPQFVFATESKRSNWNFKKSKKTKSFKKDQSNYVTSKNPKNFKTLYKQKLSSKSKHIFPLINKNLPQFPSEIYFSAYPVYFSNFLLTANFSKDFYYKFNKVEIDINSCASAFSCSFAFAFAEGTGTGTGTGLLFAEGNCTGTEKKAHLHLKNRFLNTLHNDNWNKLLTVSLVGNFAFFANQRLAANFWTNQSLKNLMKPTFLSVSQTFLAFPVFRNTILSNSFNYLSKNQVLGFTSFFSPLVGEVIPSVSLQRLWQSKLTSRTNNNQTHFAVQLPLPAPSSAPSPAPLPKILEKEQANEQENAKAKRPNTWLKAVATQVLVLSAENLFSVSVEFNHSNSSSTLDNKSSLTSNFNLLAKENSLKEILFNRHQSFLKSEKIAKIMYETPIFNQNESVLEYNNKLYKVKNIPVGYARMFKPLRLGSILKYGTPIAAESTMNKAGQIIHLSSKKITLRHAQILLASSQSILHVKPGEFIYPNAAVLTLPFQTLKTGDIVQGIPKVEQYFEARETKAGRLFSGSLPNLLHSLFKRYCSFLSRDLAVRKSILKIQQILVDGVQRVYRSQGVDIIDKHLEVIVKQMTSRVQIVHPGETAFFPGELMDLTLLELINPYLMKPIKYIPIILGITRASLEVDSFLSAASFQHTVKILSKAALYRKKDFLKGLKENLITANLIRAGTGYFLYNKKL